MGRRYGFILGGIVVAAGLWWVIGVIRHSNHDTPPPGTEVHPATLTEPTPYSDSEVQAVIDAVNRLTGGRMNQNDTVAIGEHLRPLDPNRLTLEHIDRLAVPIMNAPVDVKDAFNARLACLAKAESIDGARASMWCSFLANRAAQTYEEADRLKIPALWQAIHHPGFPAALRNGQNGMVFAEVSFLNAEKQWSSGLAQELFPLITPALPARYATVVRLFAEKALTAKTNAPREREQLRQASISYLSSVLESTSMSEGERRDLRLGRDRIAGRAIVGELVGHPAPPMRFLWCSGTAPPESLADLRGKVVVLDFWSTWCVPCRAGFPKLKALQARYGDRVVVVGVTSVQGCHVNPNAASEETRTIDTAGDTGQEFRLMADLIREAGITWRIAFSEQDAFNPDYGVKGLPHVALIDAQGVVRHNGLHIEDPDFESKIDALLK
jgi:thiol-disulfide isomerase/thioredoxin